MSEFGKSAIDNLSRRLMPRRTRISRDLRLLVAACLVSGARRVGVFDLKAP
jgi:hypothetical protein